MSETKALGLPRPPFELANRVGALEGAADPWALFDWIGASCREAICGALPRGWDWRGKRVLDFGCGAGRTLRHFVDEARVAEFHACDIDGPSIAWLRQHASPPFTCFVNSESPPFALPAGSFDLVYAISVFTHLTTSWAAWLLEVHRILKPGGLALLTFMGRGMWKDVVPDDLTEDEVGMITLFPAQTWDRGGPMVLHAPWWIEEHWGRAFEVLAILPDGFGSRPGVGQGAALLRRRDVALTSGDLERPRADDPRELASLRTNVRLLGRELAASQASLAPLQARVRAMEATRSWRLTAPLRRASGLARRLLRGPVRDRAQL